MARPKAAPAAVEPTPDAPTGSPLGWTVEEWLKGAGIPIDRISEDLAKQAESRGAVGVPAKVALNIWRQHTSPVQVEQAVLGVLGGLVKLATDGKGPHGHSGAELVG